MTCPNCDSSDFGAMETEDGIVRGCGECGYREEATDAEKALFAMDHGEFDEEGETT
jgi:uncharacterized metal-binding protein (TIGR02443 family)